MAMNVVRHYSGAIVARNPFGWLIQKYGVFRRLQNHHSSDIAVTATDLKILIGKCCATKHYLTYHRTLPTCEGSCPLRTAIAHGAKVNEKIHACLAQFTASFLGTSSTNFQAGEYELRVTQNTETPACHPRLDLLDLAGCT
jgi:hypothetical protein